MNRIFVCCMSLLLISSHAWAGDDSSGSGLDLAALLSMEVVSASNMPEKLGQAPARVLVITADELAERGYSNLTEIFDDLPSVDYAATYGDLYYKAYWRGYRKDASPFLFMIDGRVMNHLWFNRTDMLATVSMASIDRIEVVYGPASAVYGPNAMMGVFHIITKSSYGTKGKNYGANINLAGATFDMNRADMQLGDIAMGYEVNGLSLRLSGTIYNSNLDADSLENYEWTKKKYRTDRELWGGILDIPAIDGGKLMGAKHRSFMASAEYENIEVGMAYFEKNSGYGLNYAFDRSQPRGVWKEPDWDTYARGSFDLSDAVTVHSMIRYRRGDVTNDNVSFEGYSKDDGRYVTIQYWQTLNDSWLIQQDFDIAVSDDLVIKTGLNYEDRNIQMGYDFSPAPQTLVGDYDWATNSKTRKENESPVATSRMENTLRWTNIGGFAQARYDIGGLLDKEGHFINVGARYHNNSAYGSSTTLRGGYVGWIDPVNIKLLGGQSFQEPSAKQLYGAWAGSGTSSTLTPETSTTVEAVIDYPSKNFSVTLNPYLVQVTDTIVEVGGTSSNAGERQVIGGDLFIRTQMSLGSIGRLRGWLNYGYTDANDTLVDDAGELSEDTAPVGDIALHKVNFGVTGIFLDDNLTVNLRGRYVHERETVASNPIRTIPGFYTADANILYRNFMVDGLGLSLKISNILDAQYSHPGIRGANAGETPGSWDATGTVFTGSAAWTSSKLPQPGRAIMAGLRIDI